MGNKDRDRFMQFVDQLPNGCWFWTGARSRGKGNRKWYGSFYYAGKIMRAHVFACDIIGGKVCPPGYHRDHTCVFSLCVNPDHIEPVTAEVNSARKWARRNGTAGDTTTEVRREGCNGTHPGGETHALNPKAICVASYVIE